MNNGDKPAYPQYEKQVAPDDTEQITSGGLTKREFIAAMAMHGILSNTGWKHNGNPRHVAESAIVMAAELLKQLDS